MHTVRYNTRPRLFLGLLTGIAFLFACTQEYQPRPRTYFRIEIPEPQYSTAISPFLPYEFDIPHYSYIAPSENFSGEIQQGSWADWEFPAYRATIYLTHHNISTESQLNQHIEDAIRFVNHHIPRATGIEDELIWNTHNNVYGYFYHIRGRDVASPLQFFVTDSLHHFLRGALYFGVAPNNDSLAPVISQIDRDIRKKLESIRWNQAH